MKRTVLEKGAVVVLFLLVLVVFSFADRDSKKLAELYNTKITAGVSKKASDHVTASVDLQHCSGHDQ